MFLRVLPADGGGRWACGHVVAARLQHINCRLKLRQAKSSKNKETTERLPTSALPHHALYLASLQLSAALSCRPIHGVSFPWLLYLGE